LAVTAMGPEHAVVETTGVWFRLATSNVRAAIVTLFRSILDAVAAIRGVLTILSASAVRAIIDAVIAGFWWLNQAVPTDGPYAAMRVAGSARGIAIVRPVVAHLSVLLLDNAIAAV